MDVPSQVLLCFSLLAQCPSREPPLSLGREWPQSLFPRANTVPSSSACPGRAKSLAGGPVIIILTCPTAARLFNVLTQCQQLEGKLSPLQQSSPASVLGHGFSLILLHQSDPMCYLYFTPVPQNFCSSDDTRPWFAGLLSIFYLILFFAGVRIISAGF